MTFHVPIEQELVSTDVPYQVAEYDETATYPDDTEVRIDDDIYQVINYTENISYPEYQDYYPYKWKDKVTINGVGYEKYDIINAIGCWEVAGAENFNESKLGTSVDLDDLDEAIFAMWDGVADGVWHHYTVEGGTCGSQTGDDYFKFTTVAIYADHSVVQVMRNDTDSDTGANLVANIDLYPESIGRIARPEPYFIKDDEDGKIHKLHGKSSDYVASTGTDKGLWKKLDKNYDEVNKHKLEFLRKSVKVIPFDTKQYTDVTVEGSQKWVIKPHTSYNSIVIGGVSGNNIYVDFATTANPIASEILDSAVIPLADNRLSSTEKRADGTTIYLDYPEPTTQIVYSNAGAEYVIITITPIAQDYSTVGYVEKSTVGMIMPCLVIDVGATDLSFSHDIKNFDKNKVSEISGYVDHIKGNRVVQHKGTFYIPITDYDKTVLINKKFTQELIAIDSSDNTTNEAPDSELVFASTKIIGRVKQMSQKTDVQDNIINDNVKISFEFEEIV